MRCPKCHSEEVQTVDYRGAQCIVCDQCGFDERDILDISPEEKTSQKAKSRHSPYRTGGGKRSQ